MAVTSGRVLPVLGPLLLAIATAGATEEPTGPHRQVPSEICRGYFLVPLSPAGDEQRALWLVLDTGAGHSSVDPDSLERFSGRRVRTGRRVNLRGVEAGPLKFKRLPARVHPMGHLSRALGREIDGILGFDTFADLLLTLDYAAGEVHVGKGRLGEPDGREIFRDRGDGRPFVEVEIDGRALDVLLDSGSTGGLVLRPGDPVSWRAPPRPVSTAVRYEKLEHRTAGRVAGRIRFGPAVLEDPIVERNDGTRLAGYRVLRHFVLTFDHRSRRIRMRRDDTGPIRTDPVRGIGVGLAPRPEGWEVLRVFPGDPGERAGLQAGDLITAVDGTPVYERGCVGFTDPPKSTVELTLLRDGERLEREVAVEILVP